MKPSPSSRRSRGLFFARTLVVLSSLLALSGPARADLDAALPPSSNHDFTHWKLTLPFDALGGVTGVAAEMLNLQGYSSPSMYTAADGGTVFRASVNGATTKGSNYARSELREMLNPLSASVNWTDAGASILEANLKVNQVPSATGKVVVGQIHGYDTAPLIKLQYEFKDGTGKVTALINTTPTATTPLKYTLATGVALDKPFYYRIKVYKRVLSLSVNGSTPINHAIDLSWEGIGFYFKAGVYVQAKGTNPADAGQATFYRLAATHPDAKLAIATGAVAPAAGGALYTQALDVTGGAGPVLWSLISGRLPAGLVLEPATGLIVGVPLPAAADGKIHGFSVQARDGAGNSVAKTFSMLVSKGL